MNYANNGRMGDRVQPRNRVVQPSGNVHQSREQVTVTIVQALTENGFTEQAFEKPFRVFKKEGFSTAKVSAGEGIFHYGTYQYRGNRYAEAPNFISSLIQISSQ